MKFQLCDMLKIDVPVFAFSHCRDVVVEVSKAGGMGVLGVAGFTLEQLKIDLDWIDEKIGDGVYGIDMMIPEKRIEEGDMEKLEKMIPDGHRDFVNRLLEDAGVPDLPYGYRGHFARPEESGLIGDRPWQFLEEVLGREKCILYINALGTPPADIIEACHNNGMKVGALAGKVHHAIKHRDAGCDLVVSVGGEAAGHTGDISTFVLLPQIADAVAPLPVLAAGGVSTGRHVAAAMVLGAQGVWTGSIWLPTQQSELSEAQRNKIIAAEPHQTDDAAQQKSSAEIKITPALRRKAEKMGINLDTLSGSGTGGSITRDDIASAASNMSAATVGSSDQRKTLGGIQKLIAEKMVLAKQTIPHFYLRSECRMDCTLAKITDLMAQSERRISVNDAIIAAVGHALSTTPELNLRFEADNVVQLSSIDVSIAVDTGESLLTPVLRDLGSRTLQELSSETAEMIARCKENRLLPADLEGASITVSNLGMLGITDFTAIINPPQVMILAVGAVEKRIIAENDTPQVASLCTLTLACDHRVINGAAGARFMGEIKRYLESGLES